MTAPSTAAAVTCEEKPALTMNDPGLARRAEEAGLNALPAPRQVLRPGGALDTDALNTGARIRRCAALYAAQGQPCLFRVPSFQPPGLDAALDAHGYAPPEGETRILFRLGLSDPGPNRDGADGPGVELAEGQPGAEWLDAQARIAGDTARVANARRAMLAGLAIPAAFGAVRLGGPGTPLASLAYAAVRGHSIERGLGRFW